MAPKQDDETPIEAFEKLRQCFDVVKANHCDPWNWHEYMGDDPKDNDEFGDQNDPEKMSLKPKARKNADRLKSHLLACVAELNRASQAADLCYFHMCTSPQELRECVVLLGTAGDIDADLLLASGDASPAKLMAALQSKLDIANMRIKDLEAEVETLKDWLTESRVISDDRWRQWQTTAMVLEEALTRLDATKRELDDTVESRRYLQNCYNDLFLRMLRARRLMIYKGRQMLRDKILIQNKKENLFYSFHGFIFICKEEKEERLRREHEEQRDAVEFALRNEVKFLLNENKRTYTTMESLTLEVGHMKKHRRELAKRIIHKQRPPETLEYYLWIWELWQPMRGRLRLEKLLEGEEQRSNAARQQLRHASAMTYTLSQRVDGLRVELAEERSAHDLSRRELTAEGARQLATLLEKLRIHRIDEQQVLKRIHDLDVEARDERIAVLEREIAEDKHVHALQAMVVDLEGNLRKALDRRKQKPFAIPAGSGPKCSQCQREMLYRGWKLGPQALGHSASDADLPTLGSAASRSFGGGESGAGGKQSPWPTGPRGKQATYAPVWH